ncbi:MAG TPA: FtsX-like permease family protein [Candidatus Sulfotelmatobacter sp.]|jgi:putative ABC transport system permease protein|nr:FtsX-like permease family protein [Candidatus Sulfotelmatobacter sp.]
MMSDSPMFWRIVRRLITANYGRLFVILLALGAGAAITSALLNLQIDAKRRLTTEFRALGANVIVAPRETNANSGGDTLDQGLLMKLPTENAGKPVPAVAFLYVIGEVAKAGEIHHDAAVIAGTGGQGLTQVRPGRRTEYSAEFEKDPEACEMGAKAASQFKVHAGDSLRLRNQGREATCKVFAVVATGGAEDTQIFTKLAAAQMLADLPGRISLAQLSVTGTPDSIERFIAALAQRLPGADVHGIKQLAQAEGKLYNRISGLLTTTVILVLILTSLCVMAGMSNVAIERKNDVGLMKAIGGSVRRVVRLFLAEAILMGIAGGLVGSAIGILGSIWLGKAVFGVAAQPRWIVYPVSVGITIIVSIASAFPLRRLASVRPASVFRGEA